MGGQLANPAPPIQKYIAPLRAPLVRITFDVCAAACKMAPPKLKYKILHSDYLTV